MSASISRAKRNNSPVNMTPLPAGGPQWVGQVGVVEGYAVFDTEVNGWRAGATNLIAYQDRHGINTLRGIAARWAPSPDGSTLTVGNNPSAYAANASASCGISVDEVLDLHDAATQQKVLAGMAAAEDSRVTWDPAALAAGVALALGTTVPVVTPAVPPNTPVDAYHLWVTTLAGSSEAVFIAGWNAALKANGLT